MSQLVDHVRRYVCEQQLQVDAPDVSRNADQSNAATDLSDDPLPDVTFVQFHIEWLKE